MENLLAIITQPAFYQSVLRLATSLLIAAMGDLVAERSGVLNMGLEGLMLVGALFGFLGAYFTGSPWLGLLIAIVASIVIGALLAFCCIDLALPQTVVAVAINLLCAGLCGTLLRAVFGAANAASQCKGFELFVPKFLDKFPVLQTIFSQYWFTYFAILLIPVTWFVFNKTTVGLKIRAVGEDPKAASTMGIKVKKVRYLSVLYSAALCGIAGTFLSMTALCTYVDDMAAGRGYIAFAAVIFGKFTPLGAALGALVFGFADALQLNLQATGAAIPYQFLLMLPYAITLVVLFVGRAGNSPKSWAEPYISE